jgi:Kef-type K+ transport system membrane component KefB
VDLFLPLFAILIVARLLGEVSLRFGQPQLLGEIGAGVLIGLAAPLFVPLVPSLGDIANSVPVQLVGEFGIFFLILLVGIEMQPGEMRRASRSSLFVAVGGVLVPLAIGLLLGFAFLPDTPAQGAQALFIGVALSITAVAVAGRVLNDFGLLHHPVGRTIIAAAVFDDILGLIRLAVLTAVIATGAVPPVADLAFLVVKVGVFFAATIGGSRYFYPWAMRVLGAAHSRAAGFTALLVVAFAFAVLAELMGMHFIMGAFVAGLFFEKRLVGAPAYEGIRDGMGVFTYGLLAPVFFAGIGLHIDLSALWHVPGFLVILIGAAIVGKLVGGGVAARLSGMPLRDSTAVGIGMSGRGAVEIVVASIALQAGLFAQGQDSPYVAHLFSAIVVTAVVTTIATPLMLRLVIRPPGSVGDTQP